MLPRAGRVLPFAQGAPRTRPTWPWPRSAVSCRSGPARWSGMVAARAVRVRFPAVPDTSELGSADLAPSTGRTGLAGDPVGAALPLRGTRGQHRRRRRGSLRTASAGAGRSRQASAASAAAYESGRFVPDIFRSGEPTADLVITRYITRSPQPVCATGRGRRSAAGLRSRRPWHPPRCRAGRHRSRCAAPAADRRGRHAHARGSRGSEPVRKDRRAPLRSRCSVRKR